MFSGFKVKSHHFQTTPNLLQYNLNFFKQHVKYSSISQLVAVSCQSAMFDGGKKEQLLELFNLLNKNKSGCLKKFLLV